MSVIFQKIELRPANSANKQSLTRLFLSNAAEMSVYIARQALQSYKQHVLDPIVKTIAQPPASALDAFYFKEVQDYVMIIEGHKIPSAELQIDIFHDCLYFFGQRRFDTRLTAHERWLSWIYHKALRAAKAGMLIH